MGMRKYLQTKGECGGGKAEKVAHTAKFKVNHKMQGDMGPHKPKKGKRASRKRA